MPKRYRVRSTITVYDRNQRKTRDTMVEEFDAKRDADKAFEKKKRAVRTRR